MLRQPCLSLSEGLGRLNIHPETHAIIHHLPLSQKSKMYGKGGCVGWEG